MTAARLLKEARARQGISQRRLALRAGTSQAWISGIERGRVSPSLESLDRLLLVMGERLELSTTPLPCSDQDAGHRAAHRAMEPAERLARGLAFSEFADELRRAARR